MQYRRTPTSNGFSPSEMLNSRQIRTQIDTLLPSPAHIAQEKQGKQAAKEQAKERVAALVRTYRIGDPVYALYFGPRRDKDPRWVPAIVTKRKGTRTFNVKVLPRGPTWRRHLEQLQRRHISDDDPEPGDCVEPQPAVDSVANTTTTEQKQHLAMKSEEVAINQNENEYRRSRNPLPEDFKLRRSKRTIRPPRRCSPSR